MMMIGIGLKKTQIRRRIYYTIDTMDGVTETVISAIFGVRIRSITTTVMTASSDRDSGFDYGD
jgi:hypothetical protein